MNHYTLITGHNRISPASEVSEEVINLLYPILLKAKEENAPRSQEMPGQDGYYWVPYFGDESLHIDVYKNGRLCLWFVVVKNDNSKDLPWPAFISKSLTMPSVCGLLKKDMSEYSEPQAPYCAVMFNPLELGINLWIADFERCVAWAYLQRF